MWLAKGSSQRLGLRLHSQAVISSELGGSSEGLATGVNLGA